VSELPVVHPPPSIYVLGLFPALQEHLLRLLSGLTEEEWSRPTVCSGWWIKDVALHMLGVNLGNLSERLAFFCAACAGREFSPSPWLHAA
jgi:Mycothiol maleylpyruvate isomerase N-terminal domain